MRPSLTNSARLGCLTLLIGVAACGGDSGGPPSPPVMTASSTTTQTANAGSVVTTPAVRVGREDGSAIRNAVVTFVISGGGNLTTTVDTTDASGAAHAGEWRLGNVPAVSTVTATSPSAPGKSVVFTATGQVGPASSMTKADGDGQLRTAGAPASPLPSVRVRDLVGNLVQGVTVNFAVASGGGSITGAAATTDANGIATVGSWTLGTAPGANTLTATVAGLPAVTFTATVIAPSVVEIRAGNSQSGVAGSTVAIAPSVTVKDNLGAVASGVPVVFSVQGGGGSITGGTTATDANGIATVGSWTLGTTGGANTLHATVAGLAPAVFTATVVAPGVINIREGNNQYAIGGTTLGIAPSVTVLDNVGGPASGVTVTFSVASGGGSITGATAVTNASGIATVGSWTLGSGLGANTLQASVTGITPVTFTAAVVTPTLVALRTGNAQNAPPASAVLVAPSVLVTDNASHPVQGVTVTFAVASGGGSVTGTTPRSDASGVATVGEWKLGDLGDNTMIATVSGVAPVTFSAIATQYNIQLRFRTEPTPRQRLAFERAMMRWSRVISGDLANVSVVVPASQTGCYPAMNETVDDLIIFVELGPIDGVGGILGQAGPCLIRNTSRLSVVGRMTFDAADLGNMENSNVLDDVILHEMGHVLGIGTLWDDAAFPGLLVGAGTADPYFTGANALSAFSAAGGASYVGFPIPVENTGGAGTRDGHWRETVLRTELMTGFVSAAGNPMSAITIASLRDIGYTVNMGAADTYTVPGSAFIFGAQPKEFQLREQLLTDPDVIGSNGRIIPKGSR